MAALHTHVQSRRTVERVRHRRRFAGRFRKGTRNVMKKPRLGFVGLGWIGRNRLESVVQAEVAEICALHDSTVTAIEETQKIAPDAAVFSSFDELLEHDLDGVVIATPNGFHAEQAIAALDRSRSEEHTSELQSPYV